MSDLKVQHTYIDKGNKQILPAFSDEVNNPLHYASGKIECIDAMEAMLTREEFIGYLRGSCFKYQWRCRYKGKTTQDIKKNSWYLARLLKTIESE
jgi:hypothetical protein